MPKLLLYDEWMISGSNFRFLISSAMFSTSWLRSDLWTSCLTPDLWTSCLTPDLWTSCLTPDLWTSCLNPQFYSGGMYTSISARRPAWIMECLWSAMEYMKARTTGLSRTDERLDSNHTWTQHIQSITPKARRLVGLLFQQVYHYANMNLLKKTYVSLVCPHLEYAVPIWDPYTAKNCDLVENVRRFAGRVCLKSWDVGYSEILDSLNLPSMEPEGRYTSWHYCSNLSITKQSSQRPL